MEAHLEEEIHESRSELEQQLAEETRTQLTLEVELSKAHREVSEVGARVAAAEGAAKEAMAALEALEARSQVLTKTA